MNRHRSSRQRIAHVPRGLAGAFVATGIVVLIGCAGARQPAAAGKPGMLDEFCLQAQALLADTHLPFQITHYQDIDGFTRSKAMIDPPTVKQYIWYEDDARTRPAMISCKMKSADHLNLRYADATAGPDGLCQDMNRRTLEIVEAQIGQARHYSVRFDPDEEVRREEGPFSAGPAWLRPFAQATLDATGVLVIRSKGFRVDFSDPRFADSPEPFRGIQYCHFIAPPYLQRLLEGEVAPGARFGIDLTPRPAPEANQRVR